VWRFLIGAPRSLWEIGVLERISLIPVLAWVGLGADGLSSSAYGPEEAFVTLGEHRYLAVALAVVMAATVFIISSAYSRIIEEFPHGGGGYLVASKLLGERVGLVSGSALLVDYVLTITISIAAAGDAAFSFLPADWHQWKLTSEVVTIMFLTTLNLRGVRESVLVLAPIFFAFVATHVVLILAGIIQHSGEMAATTTAVTDGFQSGFATVGIAGLALLLVHSYSLGGGTYTGIEAVSNGLSIMREPRVATGKRTMLYMATSLAFTASGLLVCYLLWNVSRVEGKTLNAVLAEQVLAGWPFGQALLVFTLFTEGALLVVAAQAGFIGGPRVLGNMAVDSWMPHRFSALSDRLTTQNGVLLMGGASLAALFYTRGSVSQIVVMYSINVFFTFSMSMLGMLLSWIRGRKEREHWRSRVLLFLVGFVLCATILSITVLEKFLEGGWITILVTGLLVLLCFLIRGHYGRVAAALAELYAQLTLPGRAPLAAPLGGLDPSRPTAAVLVNSYGGLGIHTVLNIFRSFPGHYANLLFLSVGVIDSGAFKGEATLKLLREETESFLVKYVEYARGLGVPADYRMAFGTDAVEDAERLCLDVTRDFPHVTFFAGKVIFRRERWYQRILHNETASAIQRRLQFDGWPMVILPAKLA
jgi:amino acid transporter